MTLGEIRKIAKTADVKITRFFFVKKGRLLMRKLSLEAYFLYVEIKKISQEALLRVANQMSGFSMLLTKNAKCKW